MKQIFGYVLLWAARKVETLQKARHAAFVKLTMITCRILMQRYFDGSSSRHYVYDTAEKRMKKKESVGKRVIMEWK